jgi:hypothetical protein
MRIYPKGVIASYLELTWGREAHGEVRTVIKAWYAASDVVKSAGSCRGGACIVGGLYSRCVAKYPKLPKGSIVKGIRVMLTWLRLAVVPCLQP